MPTRRRSRNAPPSTPNRTPPSSNPSDRTTVGAAGFRAYLAAFVALDAAEQIQSVAVAWQIYGVAHRALDLGLVGLVLFVPTLVLAPVAGVAADRFDRRSVVALAALAEIPVCGGLLALAGRHDATALVADLAILFVAGAARAFAFPAQQALLPAIVSEERYVSASAAASAVRELVRIGAPAAGGVLVALGMLPAYATVIAGATAAAALAVRIPLLTAPPRVAPSTFRDVFAGAAFLRARPVLSGAISLDLFAVFFGGATALLPIYAAQVLHVGAVGFGALRAAASAGTALCAAVLARRPIRRFAGPRLLTAVAAFGAATIVFGLSRTVWLSFAALAALGAADMVSMVIRDALLALQTPNVMRGRVSAVEGVFIVASNELGEFESGILAVFVGAVPAVIIGGLATLCVVALWTAANPALRKADRLSSG